MALYMPQDLFDFAVVTLVRLNLVHHVEPREAVPKILAAYRFSDSQIEKELIDASENLKTLLNAYPITDQSQIDHLLTMLKAQMKAFNPDGSRKRRRIFGGTFFTSPRSPVKDKVGNCTRNMIAYLIRL